jgi:hypothetical protein
MIGLGVIGEVRNIYDNSSRSTPELPQVNIPLKPQMDGINDEH